MKYIFSLLFIICMNLNTQAQGYFSMTTDSLNRTYNGMPTFLEFKGRLHNTSGTTKNYLWKRTDLCPMPSGWSALMCDCDACYQSTCYIKPGTGVVNDSCELIYTYFFSSSAVIGSHTTLLEFYDPADSVNSYGATSVTINFSCSPTGTTLFSANQVITYPSQTNHTFFIKTTFPIEDWTCKLYSVDGHVIKSMDLVNGLYEQCVDITDLTNGIYFLQITDNHHQRILNTKIIKD